MKMKCLLPLLFCLALLLAACVQKPEGEGEEGYLLYYPAAELSEVAGEDALVTRTLMIEGAEDLTTEEVAERLLAALLDTPPDAAVRAPMPESTTLSELSVFGSRARVDFSRHYARLAGIDLTIADYCVTLTLTQLDGINAVSVTSGGRELPYRKTQTLTGADPLLSTREDALRPITVSLYFLDKASGELRAETQVLALYEGQTRVNALLEALLRGPESEELSALLPEEFSVLSARVEEEICYLNLSAETDFGTSPQLAAESLVRSLCSLESVERVQFAVEGEIVQSSDVAEASELLTP